MFAAFLNYFFFFFKYSTKNHWEYVRVRLFENAASINQLMSRIWITWFCFRLHTIVSELPIACIQFRMLETKRRERIQYNQIRASGSRGLWRGETSERAERQRKNHNTAVFQNGISCAYLLFCYCLRFPFRRYEIFFPLSFSLFVLHNIMHIQVKPYGK